MKLANVAGGVAALLIVGLPPVLGLVTEAQVRARVAALSESGTWAAEVRDFERGWFRGRAKIDLKLSPDYANQLGASSAAGAVADLRPLLGTTVPIDVVFGYGPIAIFDGVHFGLSKMVARLDADSADIARLEQSLGVPYVFEFRGRTSFFGNLVFDADVPPIDLPTAETRVRFSGAEIEGTLARNHLVANGHVDQFEFSSPTGVFTVANVTAKADNELRSQYVMPGNAGFSIERISVVDSARGAMPVFEASGLRVDSIVSVEDGSNLLDVQAIYALDSAFLDGAKLDDVHLGVAFRKLDIGALETYATTMRGLAAGSDPEAALRELRPAIERALAAGPSVTIDPARFKFNGEPFTGRLEIVTNTGVLPATGGLDYENPATLLALFGSAADVDISKKLAQQLATLALRMQYGNDPTMLPEQQAFFAEAQSGLVLVALVGQGFLTDAGEVYRAELRVTDGVVTVNGTQLPFNAR